VHGGPLRDALICSVGKASEPEALGYVEALLALHNLLVGKASEPEALGQVDTIPEVPPGRPLDLEANGKGGCLTRAPSSPLRIAFQALDLRQDKGSINLFCWKGLSA
jgi:hypothetical protein